MASKHQVLSMVAFPEAWIQPLADSCQVHVLEAQPEDQAERLMGQAEGILTPLPDRVDLSSPARCPQLREVSNVAAGVDNIELGARTKRGIPVGSTPGVLSEATADLVIALFLAVARRVPEAAEAARAGTWRGAPLADRLGRNLQGAALGIVGFGSTREAVARRASGLGLQLVFADPREDPPIEAEFQARRLPLGDLLRESDFVSLHVPLTEQTRGLIDVAHLARMKPGAILINTAWGPIVDTEALVLALEQGQLGSAGLDVTDPEPLPTGHPLFSFSNCLILPHIGPDGPSARGRMMAMACENLLADLGDRPLPHCVNPEVYRNPQIKSRHRIA